MTPAAVAKWRAYAEALIDNAIALLDELDGDPELKPSCGYLRPGELDECEPPEDDEPSLGWTVTGATGSAATDWSVDLEDDPADGPEPGYSEYEDWIAPLHLDAAPGP